MTNDVLKNEIISLYVSEPDIRSLPSILFAGIHRLIDAQAVGLTEVHQPTRDFRALISIEDDPARRARQMQAYARHMHAHPFWQGDPAFYRDCVLRESDMFGPVEFLELPIVKEALLPSGIRHIMATAFQHADYNVKITLHRVVGQPGFSDQERDRLAGFRPHILRSYRQAQERTLAQLTPADRLRLAYPALTPRQLEVGSWLAQGKSNEDIATILDIGIDAVKAHIKALYTKISPDNRRTAIAIAHTILPFADMPPLWKLDLAAWSGLGQGG